MNDEKIYELINALDRYVSDMRWTMQNVSRHDADGVFDVKRDLAIRIEACEGKLKELRKEIGKDGNER